MEDFQAQPLSRACKALVRVRPHLSLHRLLVWACSGPVALSFWACCDTLFPWPLALPSPPPPPAQAAGLVDAVDLLLSIYVQL
jgi:hypothetical protein